MRLSPARAALPLVLMLAAVAAQPKSAGRVPSLVFVSRNPIADRAPGAIPGLGPHQRAVATGGRLLVRDGRGTIRTLIPEGTFFDVADPCVSWDGLRIAFAATAAPESAWRIWLVRADGTELARLTHDDRAPLSAAIVRTFARYDDLDPCFLPDGRLVFSSTRYPLFAQQGHERTTNLFVIDSLGASPPQRLTSERNGADEPTIDPRNGRIVYARWWFNRYLATEHEAIGVTTSHARAVPADSVNLWHALTILPDGDKGKLAGGNPRVRAETAAYQPVVLKDGTLIGVRGDNLGLAPAPGRTFLQAFKGGFAAPVIVAGGPAGGAACAPVALPDGRIAFSYDPEGTGDFGLWAAKTDGTKLGLIVDLPGTLELDAAVLAPRPRPPIVADEFQDQVPRAEPARTMTDIDPGVRSFRFDCMNVFASAPVDVTIPDAPTIERDVRIRFFATLSRPKSAGGDTVVLYREAKVANDGGVHEDSMPGDTPMFEQLVDAHGKVLRSATGPAHVSGLNAGRLGSGTQCVGCHAGHSAQAVPMNYERAKRFNASPSADVSASSEAEGSSGAKAVIDRKTIGPTLAVNWVAAASEGQSIRLQWRWPIAIDSLVLYSPRPDPAGGTNLRIQQCSVVLLRQGREVSRTTLQRDLSPQGTRVACGGVAADAIEVSPVRVQGQVAGRHVAALAEIETIARLIEDSVASP